MKYWPGTPVQVCYSLTKKPQTGQGGDLEVSRAANRVSPDCLLVAGNARPVIPVTALCTELFSLNVYLAG